MNGESCFANATLLVEQGEYHGVGLSGSGFTIRRKSVK